MTNMIYQDLNYIYIQKNMQKKLLIRKFDKIEDCDTMEDVKDVDFFTI